jgi:hypothetical protein
MLHNFNTLETNMMEESMKLEVTTNMAQANLFQLHMRVVKPHLWIRVIRFVDSWGCSLKLWLCVLLCLIKLYDFFQFFYKASCNHAWLFHIWSSLTSWPSIVVTTPTMAYIPYLGDFSMVCFEIPTYIFPSNFLLVKAIRPTHSFPLEIGIHYLLKKIKFAYK